MIDFTNDFKAKKTRNKAEIKDLSYNFSEIKTGNKKNLWKFEK